MSFDPMRSALGNKITVADVIKAIKAAPQKQHMVFCNTIEQMTNVRTGIGEEGSYFVSDGPAGFTSQVIDAFNVGNVRILVLPKSCVTGWRTRLTSEQVNVHFTFQPNPEVRAQGESRVSPVGLTRKPDHRTLDQAMSKPVCQARQHSDQMICGRCGLQWDVNDPDPPQCLPRGEAKKVTQR